MIAVRDSSTSWTSVFMTSGRILTKSMVPHVITAELVDKGIVVNRKTVAKRMRMMGIEGISPRVFVPVTTIQSKRKSTLVDLVKRLFDQGQLNRVWMSDITYLRTGEGWLYLCVIRDEHSRRVLGWSMDSVQGSSPRRWYMSSFESSVIC
ncbi:hypothetical protein D8M17_02390 [Corynebacterium pseudodiphtheriticum]|nr:hypothetical protein D8M17_02390 [Corynebacterium pseudodiphtheriticum]